MVFCKQQALQHGCTLDYLKKSCSKNDERNTKKKRLNRLWEEVIYIHTCTVSTDQYIVFFRCVLFFVVNVFDRSRIAARILDSNSFPCTCT